MRVGRTEGRRKNVIKNDEKTVREGGCENIELERDGDCIPPAEERDGHCGSSCCFSLCCKSLLFFFFVPPIAAWGQPIRSTTTEKGGTENKKKNGNVTWSTVVVVLYGNFFLSFFFSYYTSLRLINSLASGGGQVEGGKFLYSASVKGTRPIQKIYFPTPFRRRRRHLPKGTYPFQGLVCLFGLGLDWPQPSGGWMLILGDLKTAGTQKKRIPVKRVMEDGKISNVAGSGRWCQHRIVKVASSSSAVL